MARILITGAHGFIGRHLARYLDNLGHEVVGLGHGTWATDKPARWGLGKWLNGNILIENLRILQEHGTPDIVFHLAGGSSVGASIANPYEDFFRTVATTVELLEWLRVDSPSTRLVAISSAAVYGAGHEGQIPETETLHPYSPYGRHKQMMEALCHSYCDSYGLRVTVARLFSVFGPELTKQLLWDTCVRLARGESPIVLGGTGEELRDWTNIREVVQAFDLIANQSPEKMDVINVGTGVGTSVRQIVQMLMAEWSGRDQPAKDPVFSGQSRLGDPFSLVAEPRLLNALGFQWRQPLRDGISDYVNWFRSQTKDPL